MAKDQAAYTLFTPAPHIKGTYKRQHVVVSDIDHIWMADLADFKDYTAENGQYRYLLTVIDVFSRWGMGEPVHNKSGQSVAQALENVFNRERRMPIKLCTDQGREFVNPQVQQLLRDNAISLYHTKDQQMKATLVERFNKTIKDSLTRLMMYSESVVWTDKIQDIMTGYNHSVHHKLKMSPMDVMNATDYQKHLLCETMMPHACDKADDFLRNVQDDQKFNVGYWVVLQREKQTFEHGFTPRWTREMFQISKKCFKHGHVMFHLQDSQGEQVEGSWLSDQLQEISGKDGINKVVEEVVDRQPGQVKVKYLGYPDKYNQWVSKHSLQPITGQV